MVIATSDSCNTLVSLERDNKQYASNSSKAVLPHGDEYVLTDLYLPADDFGDDLSQQQIYLPVAGRLDQYVKHLPEIVEGCDQILANEPVIYDEQSTERIIYVGQGEVAHAVSRQCDILVTDKATTCHMVALRSESTNMPSLTSLTHIDDTAYESCIRTMISEHLVHHHGRFEEEKKEDIDFLDDLIQLKVHIVGGFEDADGASSNISNWLLKLFAELARDFKDSIKMTLETCAVSSLNDNGYQCPIARGLAIDLRSGEVFLAKSNQSVPAAQLRAVRIWSGLKSLSVIHTGSSNDLRVGAFSYTPIPEMKQLIELPDHLVLQFTSTSPDVEEDGFCASVRSTLRYLLEVPCTEAFGLSVNQPLVFRRIGTSNSWKRAH